MSFLVLKGGFTATSLHYRLHSEGMEFERRGRSNENLLLVALNPDILYLGPCCFKFDFSFFNVSSILCKCNTKSLDPWKLTVLL